MIYIKYDYEYCGCIVEIKGNDSDLRNEFDSFISALSSDISLLNLFLERFNNKAPQIEKDLKEKLENDKNNSSNES